MNKIKVLDIKLKIVRGRPGPGEKRFQYSTLVEYILEENEDGTSLTMGVTPPTYFFLKQVLKTKLTDLERVIYHSIRTDFRIYFRELFIQNNLLNIKLKKVLAESIDEIIIDELRAVGRQGYTFSASIYLTNGQRIPNVIPSDAVVLALLAKKDIYIGDNVLKEKVRLDKEFQEQLTGKKESNRKDDKKPKELIGPKNIYT